MEDAADKLGDGNGWWWPLAIHRRRCDGRRGGCRGRHSGNMRCGLGLALCYVAECARKLRIKRRITPWPMLGRTDLRSADDPPLCYPSVHGGEICGSIGLTVAGDDPVEHVQYYTVYTSDRKVSFWVSYTSVVITVVPVGWMSENDLLRAVAAVSCGSGHPAAGELLREADLRVIRVVDAVNCESAGASAVGVVAGSRVLLGTPEFLSEHGVDLSPVVPTEASDGVLLVAIDGRFAGAILMDGE